MPQTTGLGHVGIFADDFMKQRDFYSRVIGLQIADENLERGMCFMSSDPVSELHEFVVMKGRQAAADTKTIQQISFKVPTIQDMRPNGSWNRISMRLMYPCGRPLAKALTGAHATGKRYRLPPSPGRRFRLERKARTEGRVKPCAKALWAPNRSLVH